MRKLAIVLFAWSGFAFADEQSISDVKAEDESQVETLPASYIHTGSYIQNPYSGLPSLGGTKVASESELAHDNFLQKWFTDGTWNVFAAASYVDQNGANNYGYAANIFAQSGSVAGFSFGGLLTIANPFFADQMYPANPEEQAQGLPVTKQVTPQELFAEYQYSDIVQADVGWIAIGNSPWMTYYQNNALNVVTYQGGVVNLNPGGGWLLTGFAINGAQLLGEEGFSQQTMYNSTWDNGTGTGNVGTASSPGTWALGSTWTSANDMLNVRLWGYQFLDYSNLAYADSTLKFAANQDLKFTLGLQGAIQGSYDNNGNILNNNGYGNSSRSNMLGAQAIVNYSLVGLQLGYNNIWGPADSYEAGGLISPYTYQYATDPLYTTGWIQGMVERSAGEAYKIAPSVNLLDNNLVIAPSYQYYATSIIPPSAEYDLQISYSIPQVRGLTLFAGYGYLTDADQNGDGVYQAQLMASYLY